MSLNREKKSKEGYPMRKLAYGEKLINLMENSQKILVVGVDHIGSSKLSELRKMYRGRARFLVGKNTLIRRVIRQYVRQTRRTQISSLLPVLRGNCCLIFLNGNPSIYDMVKFQNEIAFVSRIARAPRAGDIAPCDVIIRPMDTGLEPTRTFFFAAMNIATKINRGQVQIINRVCVVRAGERVGASQASLLHALGMKPFSYSIQPIALYDEGECYPSDPSLPLEMPYPNLLTVPDSVFSACKSIFALGLGACGGEYAWDGLEKVKKYLDENSRVVDDGELYDDPRTSDDDDDDDHDCVTDDDNRHGLFWDSDSTTSEEESDDSGG